MDAFTRDGLRVPSPVHSRSPWLEGLAGSLSACARMASQPAPPSLTTTTSLSTSTSALSPSSSISISTSTASASPALSSTSSTATSSPATAPLTLTLTRLPERRRSVEFRLDPTAAAAAATATATAMPPPAQAKDARCRSLSSTLDTSDSDADMELDDALTALADDDLDDDIADDVLAVNPIGAALTQGRGHLNGPITRGASRRHTLRTNASRRRRDRDRRLRIRSPASSRIAFGGWVRGESAEVDWDVLDPNVRFVRIDVCNLAWTVPTTIARRVPNDGQFQWKRVYWGLPIRGGYFVNIYDMTHAPEPETPPLGLHVLSDAPGPDVELLATSEYYSILA